MSETYQMYIIIALAVFILAFMWSLTRPVPKVGPTKGSTTFKGTKKKISARAFSRDSRNFKEVHARIRRRMGATQQ